MTYMSDHLVKLSKCPFKFEVSRNSGKGVMYSNVHNNFLKIKLLLLFHETLCYLIDSLNLYVNNTYSKDTPRTRTGRNRTTEIHPHKYCEDSSMLRYHIVYCTVPFHIWYPIPYHAKSFEQE